jgi:hypothetical protein
VHLFGVPAEKLFVGRRFFAAIQSQMRRRIAALQKQNVLRILAQHASSG